MGQLLIPSVLPTPVLAGPEMVREHHDRDDDLERDGGHDLDCHDRR
jgi:hypothetical protein